ncbi:prepilin-type N-terminal cleavage/methylation domain-containing protein [Actinoplanes sp. NPDC026670]|uniref:PulJ/GspJ family protein n=1 Tax=Actinoplanes sp. NPDC026670 TaxID=3154700 RepID=UPI0033DB6A5C
MKRREKRVRRRGDEGYSLVEVLVAASLMSVVMAVSVTAILQIYSSINRTEETVSVRDAIDVSFRRLDRELRYATWVSDAKAVNGRWYLEYALPLDKNSEYPCRQIKLENGVLTLASWKLPSTSPANPFVIASGVTADTTKGPVELYAPGAKPYASAAAGTAGVGTSFETQFQQIRLKFAVKVGKVSLPFDSVFTAQNIARGSSSFNDCSKGRPTS